MTEVERKLNPHEEQIKNFLGNLVFMEKDNQQYWFNIETKEIFLNVSVLCSNPAIEKAVLVSKEDSEEQRVLFTYNGYYYEKQLEQFIIMIQLDADKKFREKLELAEISQSREGILTGLQINISGSVIQIMEGNNFIEKSQLLTGKSKQDIESLSQLVEQKTLAIGNRLKLGNNET